MNSRLPKGKKPSPPELYPSIKAALADAARHLSQGELTPLRAVRMKQQALSQIDALVVRNGVEQRLQRRDKQ